MLFVLKAAADNVMCILVLPALFENSLWIMLVWLRCGPLIFDTRLMLGLVWAI